MSIVRTLISGFILLAIWESTAQFLATSWVPTLGAIAEEFVTSVTQHPIIRREGGGEKGFLPHVLATASTFFPATFVGGIAGLAFALLIWFSNPFVGSCFTRFLEFFRVLPPLIFIPFFLLAIDAGSVAVFASGALYATYSFAFFWLAGFNSVKTIWMEQSRLLGCSRTATARTVLVPGALPSAVSGLRVSGGITLGICIVAEYMGSAMGLGRILKFGVSYNSPVLILVSVAWAFLIGATLETSVGLMIRRKYRWKSNEL